MLFYCRSVFGEPRRGRTDSRMRGFLVSLPLSLQLFLRRSSCPPPPFPSSPLPPEPYSASKSPLSPLSVILSSKGRNDVVAEWWPQIVGQKALRLPRYIISSRSLADRCVFFFVCLFFTRFRLGDWPGICSFWKQDTSTIGSNVLCSFVNFAQHICSFSVGSLN